MHGLKSSMKTVGVMKLSDMAKLLEAAGKTNDEKYILDNHHAMMEEGLWNWTFEKICDCDKDQLNEKEKYYISFFKSQEWGYNVASGG